MERLTEEQKAELRRKAQAIRSAGDAWDLMARALNRHATHAPLPARVPLLSEVSELDHAAMAVAMHEATINPAAVLALLEENEALRRSVVTPLALLPEPLWQALCDACRAQHKPGVGGAAICACGAGGGGTRACSALRTLAHARLHAQDLDATTAPTDHPTPETAAHLRAVDMLEEASKPPHGPFRCDAPACRQCREFDAHCQKCGGLLAHTPQCPDGRASAEMRGLEALGGCRWCGATPENQHGDHCPDRPPRKKLHYIAEDP